MVRHKEENLKTRKGVFKFSCELHFRLMKIILKENADLFF